MRLRNVKNKEEIMSHSKILVLDPKIYFGRWHQLFGNNREIRVEIGMGKGQFIVEMAKRYPEINFIGIEKYDSVIVRALEKVDELPNLRLIRMNALEIDEVFQKEISIIYLNFSDPWPKKRHHERRLTSQTFLKKYDSIFEDNPCIIQKTDNLSLFEYSLLSLSQYGYIFKDLSFNLYKREDLAWNVPTEYEMRFHAAGFPIYYVVAEKEHSTSLKNEN